MSIEVVSDVFAFVLAEGEFTESILFAKEMPPELTEEERKAIEAVLAHVRASYVDLLSACRSALLARAAADAATHAVLETSWNSNSTIWERRGVSLPLVITKSWNAWLWIGISPIGREPKQALGLHAHLGVQKRLTGVLAQVVGAERADRVSADGATFYATTIRPQQGDRFDTIASRVASEVWPDAVALRERLLARGTAVPGEGDPENAPS